MSIMLTCEECGKQDDTVSVLFCGYAEDLYNEQVQEIICEACEYEHCMDI